MQVRFLFIQLNIARVGSGSHQIRIPPDPDPQPSSWTPFCFLKVFAVDLISHLSVQYALPKSLSTARLAVNAVSTLLTVLASQAREELILTILSPLTRYRQIASLPHPHHPLTTHQV